jgi:DNA-binding PadR family transcriptional regulator
MKTGMKIFAKGLLKLFILCEAEKPVSGKMITERISNLTSGKWRPSPGAIYPLLRKMEEEGLIKSELSDSEGRREITYLITTDGMKHLVEGRKRVMQRADIGTLFFPLIIKIVYNFDDTEINELIEQFEKFNKFREQFIKLPEKRRKESFNKICALFEKLMQS